MAVVKLPLICAHRRPMRRRSFIAYFNYYFKRQHSWQILIHGETRNWVFYLVFSLKGEYRNLTGKYKVFFYSNININSLCFWQEANFIDVISHMTRVVCFSSLRSSLWPVSVGGSEYLETWPHFSHWKVIPLWVEFTPWHYDMIHVKSKGNKSQGLYCQIIRGPDFEMQYKQTMNTYVY